MSRATGVLSPRPTATVVDKETLLFLLKNDRRSAVVRAIEHGAETRDEIVDLVTEWEFGPDCRSGKRKRIVVGLYQHHLPKLVDNGVVEKIDEDGETELYRRGPDFDVAVDLLDHLDRYFE